MLRGSIPASVARGGVSAVQQFKDDMAVVSRFVRLGTSAEKAKLAILRVEGSHGADRARACAGFGAARSATPPSNTGVNEGRQWLLGSGL